MAVQISHQKLAERLTLLGDYTVGITTRIYNIKKACGDPKSKPSFLSDRALDNALKHIVKRFPATDTRSGGSSVQVVSGIKVEILKSLQLYYYTFVDLLELRDHINELLTTIDACQLHLDITMNTDLTAAYLDLVCGYIALMILLSRVDDRKAVLGLYNTAHDFQHGSSEQSFPRLGQMILDYDPPLRKLAEEFIPHSRVVFSALASMSSLYKRRNLTAEQWRSAQMLSLTNAAQQMLYAAHTETMPCEYMSLERMDRWIILCLTVCHGVLTQAVVSDLWPQALQSSLCTQLFRDEVIQVHAYIQQYFETIKGYNRRVAEMKDHYNLALQTACHKHRERRKFLRTALRELCLLLGDQPGLLGPKALFVWMGLSFARDEVLWLVRHYEHWPLQQGKGKLPEDLVDRQLPELLFYMEELRGLVIKYTQVIQRYYVQYLSGYDAIALNELIQSIASCPEDESVILSSICNSIADLAIDGLGTGDFAYDFAGIRMDWLRLQAYTSCARSGLQLTDCPKLAQQLNTLVFHTRMVDWLDQMLIETADLSVFCFHVTLFERWFQLCLEFPAQARYLPAFPLLCAHFANSLHDLCPEERQHIGERSLTLCNTFLDELSKEAKNVLTNIAEQHCLLADKLLPKHCAKLLGQTVEQQRKSEKKAAKSGNPSAAPAKVPVNMPGEESYRKTREEMTMLDKLHVALTELCCAINYAPRIVVWEHTFCPREYFTQHLETRFNKTLVGMVMYNADRQEIAKPSELLSSIRAFMNVIHTIAQHVEVDIPRVFNYVLLQQTQALDCYGEETVTALYTKWYLEVMLRRVSTCQILYSPHQMAFVLHPSADSSLHFNPQEYTDFFELRSLCELLGPYGVKFLCERLTWHVATQTNELKKLVVQSKDILRAMRSNFDKPERLRQLYHDLLGSADKKSQTDPTDSFLQRLAIIGEILHFRDLLQSALHDVLADRIPFLVSSVADFRRTFVAENADTQAHPELLPTLEMFQSLGFSAPIDATLVNALKAQKPDAGAGEGAAISADEDYHLSCLLMVFIAVCLPKVAQLPAAMYKATTAAHLNNVHCLAKAVNEMAAALFQMHGRGDAQERMKEFLALSSGSLLRLVGDQNEGGGSKNPNPNLESTYILLDKIVQDSPYLSVDLLESCFPYVLLRSAYHYTYKQEEAQGI